ncbi:MAG: N-formylglutamate amidohydrolase [Proteobacteria bacterium]|nr:N-formylglutamate amidohydrolase [Pseudomonadota bacterium]
MTPDSAVETPIAPQTAYEILRPARQTAPLVLSSPHSGRDYPSEFVAEVRLDALSLRRSEDSFVDELFAAAPGLGAPLIRALFPRAYIDANREPYELDPEMFDDALPAFANTASKCVRGGLGTIARVVADGAHIYRRKLCFAEAEARIRRLYEPYHAALGELIGETLARFGCAILVDCHSMPSVGGPMDRDAGAARVDIVLGDCHGASCHAALPATVERLLRGLGYVVRRNAPYAGGYTTRHYGAPRAGVHALQIEINRALYMDEARIERGPRLAKVAGHMARVIEALAAIDPAALAAPAAGAPGRS